MGLTEREKIVLTEIVGNFIDSATPVSSASISKKSKISLSPATVRGIMASLELKGYIHQPHTSAGRMPNTSGYRVYVDSLMKKTRLSLDEQGKIYDPIKKSTVELDEVLKAVTGILAQLSKQLGIIVSPPIEQGVLQRIELFSLSSDKILAVITIESGLVKNFTIKVNTFIEGEKLQLVSRILNERLQGLKICEIRTKFSDVVKDIRHEESGLIKMLSQKADKLFDFGEKLDMYFMGTHNILQQRDFSDVSMVSSVVELVENKKIMVHFMDQENKSSRISIKIGEEFQDHRMQVCSIVTASYHVGRVKGMLGVIGPTRMNYSKIISLVDFTAQALTNVHGSN